MLELLAKNQIIISIGTNFISGKIVQKGKTTKHSGGVWVLARRSGTESARRGKEVRSISQVPCLSPYPAPFLFWL